MTIKTMLSGVVVVESWAFVWTDASNPGGTTVNLTNGDYYVTGGGDAADLLAEMKTRVDAIAASTLSYTISDTGLVGFAVASGTATISAAGGGASTALAAALGFTVTSLGLTTAYAYAAKTPPTTVVSTLPARVDVPTSKGRRSVVEADDYSRGVLSLSQTVQQYRLNLRFRGPHRSDDWTEFYPWRRFYESVIHTGIPCRWYPDASQSTAAYAEKTNPYGYHVGRIVSPTEFTPAEVVNGWYRYYAVEMELLVGAGGTIALVVTK